MNKIRVMIVDDHPIVCEGLRTMLEPKPDIELVGEARNGYEAIEKAKQLFPDVILMDLMMPKMDGGSAIKQIEGLNLKSKILVLTSLNDEEKIIEAISAGAKGYILKDSDPSELVKAIRKVHLGELWLNPEISSKVLLRVLNKDDYSDEINELTKRELDVLKLVAKGLSNLEIAEQLCVSEGTVRFHVTNMLTKLELSNRTQLALYALRKGLVSL
jgi:NarL family two-component system response regulator LiaR